jgi:hypothetical protein
LIPKASLGSAKLIDGIGEYEDARIRILGIPVALERKEVNALS